MANQTPGPTGLITHEWSKAGSNGSQEYLASSPGAYPASRTDIQRDLPETEVNFDQLDLEYSFRITMGDRMDETYNFRTPESRKLSQKYPMAGGLGVYSAVRVASKSKMFRARSRKSDTASPDVAGGPCRTTPDTRARRLVKTAHCSSTNLAPLLPSRQKGPPRFADCTREYQARIM